MNNSTENPFFRYANHTIDQNDIQAVVNVLKSDFLTQGKLLTDFEGLVCDYIGARYAIATNSATSALHLACLALEVGKGDLVWTSPISFVASANCALYCGANIDFVDINYNTALISVDLLSKKLERAKKNNTLPKLIIVVHLAGSSCDMHDIYKLSIEYGFKVIEDASHAIGGSYKNQKVGTCKYSDITIFSFHPVKIITTGEGGMAVTNNADLAKKIRNLRGHGIVRNGFELEPPGPWYYEMQSLGYNYRITEIQCALGISQLKKIDSFVKLRNELIDNYIKLFSEIENISIVKAPKNVYSSYHLAIIHIHDIDVEQHKNLFKFIRSENIFVQLHYWPIHLNPYYRKLGFKQGQFPFSEKYATSSFSIPLYPTLTNKDQDYIVTVIKYCLSKIL